jgi:hypothetical protein
MFVSIHALVRANRTEALTHLLSAIISPKGEVSNRKKAFDGNLRAHEKKTFQIKLG